MADRGRGTRGTNDPMERIAQILEALVHNQGREPAEYQGLSAFTRHDPQSLKECLTLREPRVKGKFNSREEQWEWLRIGLFQRTDQMFQVWRPHMVNDCPQPRITCSNCGKSRHTANVCWTAKRGGSTSTAQRPKSRGNTEPRKLLDVMFNSGATHCFVSVDCVKSLNLYITKLPCNVVVTTPMGKPVVTSWVCLGCSIMVHGREFEVDLICLSLSQLDIILGIDWLTANHMLLDYREKTLIFDTALTEVPRLMSQGAWENTVNAKAFMVMFSMKAKSMVEPEYIPVVRDFLKVSPEDVSELPPEKEIKFTIDLIPRANPIFVAPYRMSLVELVEVKK
ncbi:uncharacterized protein LOC113871441 [Abrus precatorius]|uniref:Uncharacterized protein LOC113871441 n=1 Tax=Abrus precatorius TaxID=3816 RepID=A0A8B8M8I0_ABRPR|nr:uncharacterized protein LOC113871441 [Abrus precatorius]